MAAPSLFVRLVTLYVFTRHFASSPRLIKAISQGDKLGEGQPTLPTPSLFVKGLWMFSTRQSIPEPHSETIHPVRGYRFST